LDDQRSVAGPVWRRDRAPSRAGLWAGNDLEHVAHPHVDVFPELGLHAPLGDLASSVIGDEAPRRPDVDPCHAHRLIHRLDIAEWLTSLHRPADHGSTTQAAGPHAYLHLLPTAYSS